MELFQVIEDGEGIERTILRALSGRSREVPAGGQGPALLVVSPRAAERGLKLPERCRTALVPGEMGERAVRLQAASAVSYGTSPRDSLTVSSREGNTLWAALQREVVTLSGQVIERQEFPLTLAPGEEALPALAAAGALLLLGASLEELR